jgi:hypothetical protein
VIGVLPSHAGTDVWPPDRDGVEAHLAPAIPGARSEAVLLPGAWTWAPARATVRTGKHLGDELEHCLLLPHSGPIDRRTARRFR